MDLYSYDSAGNLLNDGVHSYFYDAENHLIQVDGTLPYCTSNGASGSAATACYYYDARGSGFVLANPEIKTAAAFIARATPTTLATTPASAITSLT